MLVTAVVPLHNHANWVGDALESLDRQELPAERVIVVDDGSTDGSFDAAAAGLERAQPLTVEGVACAPARLVRGYRRGAGTEVWLLRYETARGPSFARNRGLELGLGLGTDLFALLDSDDLYAPGKLARSVPRFADPLVGAVYSDYDTLRPDGLRLREWKPAFTTDRLKRECIVNCDSLVSAAAIQKCGGFDEALRVCEDYDLWLRISERYLIVHLAESLVTVRVGQHSSTSTVKSEVWNGCWRRVMEKANARANAQT
jgi:glycosyltransferase involved in cell wall biosynthesis